jgi:hypothetical protein
MNLENERPKKRILSFEFSALFAQNSAFISSKRNGKIQKF